MTFHLPALIMPAAVAAAAIAALPGCDPLVEPRSGVGGDELSDGLEPTPGGGTCEECVHDAVLSADAAGNRTLELCIDNRVKYVGRTLQLDEDVRLVDLLTGPVAPHWAVLWSTSITQPELVQCSSKASGGHHLCGAEVSQADSALVKLRVSLAPEAAPGSAPPTILRFAAIADTSPLFSRNFPAMRLRLRTASGVALNCPYTPLPAAPKSAQPTAGRTTASASHPSVAHVTRPYVFGGVRSCSGVLITPGHVLTARHCFMDDLPGALTDDLFQVEVRFTAAGQVTSRAVAAIVEHPELDLAVVELAAGVEAPHVPMPIAPAHQPECKLTGYGVGVSMTQSDPNAFDWGRLHGAEVKIAAPGEFAPESFPSLDPAALLLLDKQDPTSNELCRGDSGGPIVQVCGGVQSVVGITFARIYNDASRGAAALEYLSDAFAFSYGNACGAGPHLLSLATRLDDDVQSWIDDVTTPDIVLPPVPPPANN